MFSIKYSLARFARTSSFRTAIRVFHTLCMQSNITMSHGTPSVSSKGKNRIPKGVNGNSFLMVLCRISQRKTESQHSRKMCSIVSGFLQMWQLTLQGTKIPFSCSHGLTGSVPVCSIKKKVFVVGLTGIPLTRFNTFCSRPSAYIARYIGTGHIIFIKSLYNRFLATVLRYSIEKCAFKKRKALITSNKKPRTTTFLLAHDVTTYSGSASPNRVWITHRKKQLLSSRKNMNRDTICFKNKCDNPKPPFCTE